MNTFRAVFEHQKRHFASGVTRTYQWRIEQLDRMARLVGENEIALQQKGLVKLWKNPDRFTQKLL
jgi:aldehyde dehydrogenase (NAD+)